MWDSKCRLEKNNSSDWNACRPKQFQTEYFIYIGVHLLRLLLFAEEWNSIPHCITIFHSSWRWIQKSNASTHSVFVRASLLRGRGSLILLLHLSLILYDTNSERYFDTTIFISPLTEWAKDKTSYVSGMKKEKEEEEDGRRGIAYNQIIFRWSGSISSSTAMFF